MAEHVGSLLKRWRTARGLSLGALGLIGNVGKSTLSEWESGKRTPRITELEGVLTALGAGPAERTLALACVGAPRAIARLREEGGGSPVAGDLLRAMRMRARKTQTDLARLTGFRQASIARWEKSEDWPSADRLLVLSRTLGARPEEERALLSGRFEPPMGIVFPVRAEDMGVIEIAVHGGPAPHTLANLALLDLRFLSYLSEFHRHSLRSEPTFDALTRLYGQYSRRLHERGRHAEGRRYTEIALTRAAGRWAEPWLWADAMMAQVIGAKARGATTAKEVIRLANGFLPRVSLDNFGAWLRAERGIALASLGYADAGLAECRASVRVANDLTDASQLQVEPYFRTIDVLKACVASGDRRRIADFLESDQRETVESTPGPELTHGRVWVARAYREIGETDAAHRMRADVDRHLDANGLAHLRPDWNQVLDDA